MKKTTLILIMLALLITACSPKLSPSDASLAAWIDAPLDESTIPPAPYEIVVHGSDPEQINLLEISVNDEIIKIVENPDLEDLLFSAHLIWTPTAPGIYTIQARSQNKNGDWSNPALARVYVEEDYQPGPVLELLPTGTPALDLVICEPQVKTTTNTTCRQGPSTYNDPVVYLMEGDSAPVLGTNQDQSWWAVQPETSDEPCWISGTTVDTTCIPEEPEVLQSPPYITRVFPSHNEFYWADNPLRSVTVQAQCGGEIPVTGVRLYYHLAGRDDWYNAAMSSTGGEIWKAQISSHTFDDYNSVTSTVVEYYLIATNQSGLTTRSLLINDLILKDSP